MTLWSSLPPDAAPDLMTQFVVSQGGVFGLLALADIGLVLTSQANTFTTGPQTMQTGADGNVGLVVKGNSPTQAADLHQWQDSAGNVRAAIKPTGEVRITSAVAVAVNIFLAYDSTAGQVIMGCGRGTFDDATLGYYQSLKIAEHSVAAIPYLHGFKDGAAARAAIFVAPSAVADANVGVGRVVMWLDESGHNLMFKVRYSDGVTVKSGTLPLV